MCQTFAISSFNKWYFSNFSSSLSFTLATLIMTTSLSFLSIKNVWSSWRSSVLSVLIGHAILKQFGQLKSKNLHRLYYTEEGCTNIEQGIRVAEFTTLNRDLLRKIVPQRMEIFFKYTGQPLTCYRCSSTDHIEKNSLKQRMWFGHIYVEDLGQNEGRMHPRETPFSFCH